MCKDYVKRKPEAFQTETPPVYDKRITGIEPASPAWEAGVLPMNYIRIHI